MKHFLCLILLLTAALNSYAQNEIIPSLKTIDGTIDELLDQITIEEGEKMDTAAVRKLFHPSAIFTVGDSSAKETVTLNDFIELLSDPYYEEGYLEKNIHRVVEEYNGIAHVFETFYGEDSEGERGRGINSYQLAYYADRWWIVSLLWTVESDTNPIPAKYGG